MYLWEVARASYVNNYHLIRIYTLKRDDAKAKNQM